MASSPLDPWSGCECHLALPGLKAMSPGRIQVLAKPHELDGVEGQVVATNMAGLLLVVAANGSVHVVDDVERELGTIAFPTVRAFAAAIEAQNQRR